MEDGMLYYAVVENDVAKLTELLNQGGNVDEFYEDAMNISSKSLLHVCCGKGYVECLKVLIDHGAQLDVRDKWGQTPLMYSVSIQFPEVAQLLLEADAELVKCQDRFGKSPLHCAVEAGNEELVHLLLKYGADLNVRCHDGMTPLMTCCAHDPEGERIGVMKVLLEYGAILDLKDYRGNRTALHVAVVSSNVQAVETLIAAGANVNDIDKSLRTPLTLAIFGGVRGPEVKDSAMSIITLLVSAGAELDVCVSESCNPLLSAALVKSETMVQYFLALGANPDISFPSGVTPALVCASTGDLANLRILLRYNCNLTIKGKVYKRRLRSEFILDPFELAYMEGYLDLCVLMVEAGYPAHRKLTMFEEDARNPNLPTSPGITRLSQMSEQVPLNLALAKELPENYKTILSLLIDFASNPRSLRDEALFTIRYCVGKRLVNGVNSLPLPQSVKNFILLSHLLT